MLRDEEPIAQLQYWLNSYSNKLDYQIRFPGNLIYHSGWVGGWVGACVRACVRGCVCVCVCVGGWVGEVMHLDISNFLL